MALKPRIQDVLETLVVAISNACNTAGVTENGQTIPGIPVVTELEKIMRDNNQEYLISVYERPGTSRDQACFPPAPFQYADVSVPLTATVTISGGHYVITFGGASGPGLNIHTFVGAPAQDALVQPGASDALATIATKVATAITALDIEGVTATANGDAVTVAGSPVAVCNIGGSGSCMAQLVGRVEETIQATIWVPSSAQTPQEAATQTAPLRWRVAEAIRSYVGTTDVPPATGQYFALSDGTGLKVSYVTQAMDDNSQVEYSFYLYHVVLCVQYDLIRVIPGTQVAALKVVETINNGSPVTQVSGGT